MINIEALHLSMNVLVKNRYGLVLVMYYSSRNTDLLFLNYVRDIFFLVQNTSALIEISEYSQRLYYILIFCYTPIYFVESH